MKFFRNPGVLRCALLLAVLSAAAVICGALLFGLGGAVFAFIAVRALRGLFSFITPAA